jgi:hypothetical protein
VSPALVLTAAAAVLISAVIKSRRQESVSVRKVYAGRDPVEVMANNLKAAADALIPLMAA